MHDDTHTPLPSRQRVEAAIEALVALLDDIDAETEDLEEDDVLEPNGDELDGDPKAEDEHQPPPRYVFGRCPPLGRFGNWQTTDRPGIVHNATTGETWDLSQGRFV